MDEFIQKTKVEAGCVFYGWVKTGDKLRCHEEAYVDGAAVNAHLANVGECIGKLLEGPASLESIGIGGPAAEQEKTKEGTAALDTVYYKFDSGFNHFKNVLLIPTDFQFKLIPAVDSSRFSV